MIKVIMTVSRMDIQWSDFLCKVYLLFVGPRSHAKLRASLLYIWHNLLVLEQDISHICGVIKQNQSEVGQIQFSLL